MEQTDRTKLQAAERALIDLTDECGGACAYGQVSECICRDRLWPAIEAIRTEIAATVAGN